LWAKIQTAPGVECNKNRCNFPWLSRITEMLDSKMESRIAKKKENVEDGAPFLCDIYMYVMAAKRHTLSFNNLSLCWRLPQKVFGSGART